MTPNPPVRSGSNLTAEAGSNSKKGVFRQTLATRKLEDLGSSPRSAPTHCWASRQVRRMKGRPAGPHAIQTTSATSVCAVLLETATGLPNHGEVVRLAFALSGLKCTSVHVLRRHTGRLHGEQERIPCGAVCHAMSVAAPSVTVDELQRIYLHAEQIPDCSGGGRGALAAGVSGDDTIFAQSCDRDGWPDRTVNLVRPEDGLSHDHGFSTGRNGAVDFLLHDNPSVLKPVSDPVVPRQDDLESGRFMKHARCHGIFSRGLCRAYPVNADTHYM